MVKEITPKIQKEKSKVSIPWHKQGVWGNRLFLISEKTKEEILFESTYIIPKDEKYIVRSGSSPTNSKVIGIFYDEEKAAEAAYAYIEDKPFKRLMNNLSKIEDEKFYTEIQFYHRQSMKGNW